ncbi:hypothetical protein PROFUN_03791 [Planoprotostelium fungivorum]|uniref:Right handed beta helix domain-containing protein n=1 Tax=Planoprotostelium fungivorum TaxID=1890364 RepID=A0A2P6NDU2_9EUKA|nr:hypothetical protein PROFUN_03791 [Planoprotostelium fungivorum]
MVSSLDDCETYVDSHSGSDTTSCGDVVHPCRTIPLNSTNVCLSSGQYSITDRLPPKMRAWWPASTEVQNPQITCTGEVILPCDSIYWNHVDISNCIIDILNCKEIALKSARFLETSLWISTKDISLDSAISDCLFNHSFLSTLLSSSESFTKTITAPTHLSFIGNHLINTNFIFEDTTVGIPSFQEFINNTVYHPTEISTVQFIWSGVYDRGNTTGCRFLAENNTVESLAILITPTSGTPDVQLFGNHFKYLGIDLSVRPDNPHGSLSALFERNTVSTLRLNKEGPAIEGAFIVRQNHIQSINLLSDGLQLVIQNNNIGTCKISEKRGFAPPATGNTITDNVISLLKYNLMYSQADMIIFRVTEISRNTISNAYMTITANTFTKLCMVDNVWTGPTADSKEPALHIPQMQNCAFFLRNSSIDGYRGGGIRIGSAVGSDITFESISVSNCETGGITISTEASYVNLTSIDLYNNTSPTVGGAIFISSQSESIIVHNCNLIHNRSPHSSALFLSSEASIHVTNVSIIVEDDVKDPLVDHSVVTVSGQHDHENVSLSCAEERYLASSLTPSSLMWSCRPCSSGSYLLGRGEVVDDVERGNECLACPNKGVECVEGKTPQGHPDYWCGKSRGGELICHICPNGYCNASLHLWNEPCIGHRSGDLCGGCADNYTLGFLTSSCLPLDHCRPQWIVLLSFIPFVYVTVLLFLPIGDGSMWKSMSYFVQTAPLLLKQEKQNTIITMFSSLFTTPTNMGSSAVGICIGQMDYIQREFLSLYLPIGTVVLFLFFCLCVFLYHKIGCQMPSRKILFITKALEERNMISRCTTGLLTAFLLMYSGLIASYLKLFFCVEIEPSRSVMYNAGTETCDQPWRIALVTIASITLLPSPLFLIFMRRKLRGTERETGRDVLMVLDGCYRKGRKYWESVYMVRRLAIAVAYVFITDDKWSATAMRFLLVSALFFHLFFTPFVTLAGQSLETICLLSLCCLTLLNGQLAGKYEFLFLIFILFPFIASSIIGIHKLWMKWKKKKETLYEPLLSTEEQLFRPVSSVVSFKVTRTCPLLVFSRRPLIFTRRIPPDLGFEPKAYSLEGCRSSN